MKGKPEFLSPEFLEYLRSKGFTSIGDIKQECKCNWLNSERCDKCRENKSNEK